MRLINIPTAHKVNITAGKSMTTPAPTLVPIKPMAAIQPLEETKRKEGCNFQKTFIGPGNMETSVSFQYVLTFHPNKSKAGY